MMGAPVAVPALERGGDGARLGWSPVKPFVGGAGLKGWRCGFG